MVDDTLRQLIQLEIDQSKIRSSIAGVKQAKTELKQLGESAKLADLPLAKLETTSTSLATRLKSSVVDAAERVSTAMRGMKADTDAATQSLERQQSGASGIGDRIGRAEGFAGQAGAALSGLGFGGAGSAVSGGADALMLASIASEALTGIGASAAVVSAAVPVAGVALAGIGLIIAEVGRQAEEARQRAQNFFTSQEEISRLIESGATSADIQALIDARQNEYEAIEAQRRTLQPFIDQLEAMEQAVDDGTMTVFDQTEMQIALNEELSRATGGAITSISTVRTRFDELTLSSDGTLGSIEDLNLAMRSEDVIANDAALAVADHNAKLEEGVRLTKEAAEAQTALNNELDVNNRAKAELDVSMAKAAQESAAAAAAATAAIEKDKATRQIAAAQTYADAEIAILADLGKARQNALAELNNGLREAEANAVTERAEAITAANEDLAQLEIDHKENIARINRQYNRSDASAIQDRNAVALDASQTAREDELQAEEQAASKQQVAIEKALMKQQQTIAQNLTKQQTTLRDSYNRQLQTAAEKARLELQRETQKQNAALGIQQQGNNAQLQQQANFQKQLTDVVVAGLQNTLNAAKGALGGGAVVKPIPKAANGANVLTDGLVYVHAGETIRNRSQQGGVSVNVNGWGMTPRQVGNEVTRQLEVFVRG